jgi:hypothetical protein
MEIYAITLIARLAGAIGSFLQERGEEIDDRRCPPGAADSRRGLTRRDPRGLGC